jgi:putative phosphoesterase
MQIGVISDTHGLLRPEAVASLRGSDRIIHAGDIGNPAILDQLNEIAPVTAVRGNVDRAAWALKIPETNILEVEGFSVYVIHILQSLDLKPEAAGFAAVVYGHSHVPKQETKHGVLYFNPGSAGPRRFRLPVTVGLLSLEEGKLQGRIVELLVRMREVLHPFSETSG